MAYPWGAALHYLSAVFVPVFAGALAVAAVVAVLAGLAVCVRMRRRQADFIAAPIPAQRVGHEGATRR